MLDWVASILCLALGVSNLALLDLVLVPRYLTERQALEAHRATRARSEPSRSVPPLEPSKEPGQGSPVETSAPLSRGASVFEAKEKKVIRGDSSVAADGAGPAAEPRASSLAARDRRPPTVERSEARWSIQFAYGSAAIEGSAEQKLHEILTHYRSEPIVLLLEGHADPSGSKTYNLHLSWERASAVGRWLERAGVASDHLRIHAFGEEGPLPEGAAPLPARARRRVDVSEAPKP